MVSLTVFIQLIAALTIPATVGCIAMTQLNTGAKFQWKQGRIALVLSIVPLLLVLTLQGILGSVSTLLAIGGLLVVVLLGNPD